MKYGLSEDNLDRIFEEFKKFPEIEGAVLYGSRAKGNYKPASDIDLTLQGNLLSTNILNKLNWALDDLLLPYTFDISLLKDIKQEDLLDHINRIGIQFYTR